MKNVLNVSFIGLLLVMMQGAHAIPPTTVTGCVELPDVYYGTCGFNSPGAMAITSDGKTGYLCNLANMGGPSSVSIIDIATDTVVGCVENDYAEYPNCPFENPVAIAIYGNRALVCNTDINSLYGTISIIDITTNTVIGCVDDSAFPLSKPAAIAISGTKAYVCNIDGGSVGIIDLTLPIPAVVGLVANSSVTCPFNQPTAIAIYGSKAYVCNAPDSGGMYSISIIDVGSNTVTGCVADPMFTLKKPHYIAIAPNGTRAYVTNFAGASVSIVDLTLPTPTIIGVVANSNGSCMFNVPLGVSITPSGTTAYVCNVGNNSVSIVDLTQSTPTVVGCVEVPYAYASCGFDAPGIVTLTPDGTKGYISNVNGNSVSVMAVQNIPGIFPPASVNGCKTQNIFLLQTDFINNITWTAPISGTPVAYKIYRDPALTQLVATVPASGPLQYYDHDRNPGIVYSYYIVSVDGSGGQSAATSVTVTNPC